jgi:prepilin-type N-terminal cleavage/methylation domain-containing protein
MTRQRGTSLVEVTVVMAVIAVLTAAAAPSITGSGPLVQLRLSAEEAQADLGRARMDAAQRNETVTVAFVEHGYTVRGADGALIKAVTLEDAVLTHGHGASVVFDPSNGSAAQHGGPVHIGHPRSKASLHLNVTPTGRAHLCAAADLAVPKVAACPRSSS